MVATAAPSQERSVGQLFGELATETRTLVSQEVHLAVREMSQKAAYAGKRSVPIVAGSALALVSLMTLAGGFVVLLGRVLPLWASAFIVAVIVGAGAYACASLGIKRIKRADLKPTQTIGSLKDDKTWLINLSR